MKTAILIFIAISINGLTCNADPQVEDNASDLATILRPYVHPLDRDLWTFRYEGKDKFQPKNVADLQNRIGPWAERFWNASNVRGADTGPGVYVATDPAATATWGGPDPRLFAIKIKAGTNILMGDQYRTPDDVLKQAQALSARIGCGSSSTSMDYDIGHLVGFFRMNENLLCRQAAIGALKALNVKALSYSFNSVPLKGCRTTGTAISIIAASAISLEELNRYSDDGNIEGQPDVSPYVYLLFEEAKSDYYSQSLLWSLDVWKRYQSEYGFFANTPKADTDRYETWKAEHIFKCGASWSIESDNSEGTRGADLRRRANPRVKDLLIRMALVYREKFRDVIGLPDYPAPEFEPVNLWKLKQRVPQDRDSLARVFTAQVPTLSGDTKKDEDEYIDLLQSCLTAYQLQTPAEIAKGSCRLEPWQSNH